MSDTTPPFEVEDRSARPGCNAPSDHCAAVPSAPPQ
jgi:hypothetical protein